MIRVIALLFLCVLSLPTSSHAALSYYKGKFCETSEIAFLSPEEHYAIGAHAYECGNWQEAALQFNIVSKNFPEDPLGKNAFFFYGVSLFHLGYFEFSNKAFSQYIAMQSHPEYFEEVIYYKFEIAEAFRNGACRHLFGMKRMPRWLPADKLAEEIYDEVIALAPTSEAAVQSYYFRAFHLWNQREFREAIVSLEVLVRKFPKHELAPESYIAINQIYYDWSLYEFQNPDILALAIINTERFERDFPSEPRVEQAKCNLLEIQEAYAQGLYETAKYFERRGKCEASVIYYRKTFKQFPETVHASKALRRLNKLCPSCLEE